MAADPGTDGIGEWAWRIASAIVGAGIMLVGFVKAWAATARDAREAKSGLPRIHALELWRAGAEASHQALIDRLDELKQETGEIRDLQNRILERLPRGRS